MFYRITCSLNAADTFPIDDIYDKILDHWSDFITINPDQPDAERSFVLIEHCHHDEHPSTPCDVIDGKETD